MTISFPRTVPDSLKLAGLSFYPEPMLEVSPTRGGKAIALDIGPTLWRAKYEVSPRDETALGEIRAWYDTLTSLQDFYGYDVLREYPLAYKDSGFSAFEGFDGTCTLADVGESKITVDLEDLPEGFTFSPGDYIAFDYGSSSRALHRVSAAGTADSNGDVTLEIRPPVRVGWAEDATVYLHKPAARMKIIPGTWADPVDGERIGHITFEARQVL